MKSDKNGPRGIHAVTSFGDIKGVHARTSLEGPCLKGSSQWPHRPWTSWRSPSKDLARSISQEKKGTFLFSSRAVDLGPVGGFSTARGREVQVARAEARLRQAQSNVPRPWRPAHHARARLQYDNVYAQSGWTSIVYYSARLWAEVKHVMCCDESGKTSDLKGFIHRLKLKTTTLTFYWKFPQPKMFLKNLPVLQEYQRHYRNYRWAASSYFPLSTCDQFTLALFGDFALELSWCVGPQGQGKHKTSRLGPGDLHIRSGQFQASKR
jgi:hypothetical protein